LIDSKAQADIKDVNDVHMTKAPKKSCFDKILDFKSHRSNVHPIQE
jgi:hypothetical protein